MQYVKNTIAKVFVDTVKNNPSKDFISYDGFTYTYNDLYKLVCIEADNLEKNYKVNNGDFIAIYGQNSLDWLVNFLALQMLGAKAILFNPHFKYPAMQKMIAKHQIKLVLYSDEHNDANFRETIELLAKEFNNQTVFKNIKTKREDNLKRLNSSCPNIEPYTDYNSVALVIFTSGSTGVQKGVMLSHYSVLNNAKQTADNMKWNKDDIFCVSVPFFHCFGLTTCILTSIIVAAKLCVINDFTSEKICRTVEMHKCTILNGVPTMFLAMIKKSWLNEFDLSSLKSGIIAGSPIYENDYIEICKTLPNFLLQPSYGQSETSPCISITSLNDSIEIKSKSVGKVIEGVQIRIRSVINKELLGINQIGEIEVKGYNVMKAYLNDKIETASVLSNDNWLKTGDIGYIDNEGYLYIEGRKKNLIIRAGENISPLMIESAIKSFDASLEVVVLGVKSDVLQEEVVACIIDRQKDDELVLNLKEYLKNELESYAVPKYFLFFENVKRTAVGKIDLKDLYERVKIS